MLNSDLMHGNEGATTFVGVIGVIVVELGVKLSLLPGDLLRSGSCKAISQSSYERSTNDIYAWQQRKGFEIIIINVYLGAR